MDDNGKVLFIIHDVYQEDNVFPNGVGYLSAVLKKNRVDVRICCQDVYHYPNEKLIEFLKRDDFDLIGLSFLAARFKETVLPLCRIIEKYKKKAWLVLGGNGPSPIPEYMLKETHADIVVIGEAEETIMDLLKCKLESVDLSQIKSIAYRNGNEIYVNKRRKPVMDLDSIPFPEWSLFPMEKYTNCFKTYKMSDKDKFLSIITSRGCINKCNFCYRMEKGFRFRSVKNVIEEIITLKDKYGVTYFRINDELFTYPRKRVFEFQEELEKNDIKIKFDCDARVDTMDDEIAEALKGSGCQFINLGLESTDQNVLDLMKKNINFDQNIKAVEILREKGIGIGLNFIWGNIGDTDESLKNNVRFIKKYNTYYQIRTIRPVTPFPGSELYNEAIKRELLSGPEDFFTKFKNSDLLTVNFTDFTNDKFYKLLYEANKDLISDHYQHTSQNLDDAKKLIKQFYDLYFFGKTKFRGVRHYNVVKNN